MGSSMSGHKKQVYINQCKTTQMEENLKVKDIEMLQAQWVIEEYEKMAAQDAKSLKLCKHDFKWMIAIALALGFSIGWMARGIV
jgi:hypothetical protein